MSKILGLAVLTLISLFTSYEQPEAKEPVHSQYLGEFTVTYYTAGKESTGKSPSHPAYGVTKSGAVVEEGVTIAVDPKVIPLGTYVYIEEIGFRVAQDTGKNIKGNRIDVYVKDVDEAIKLGKHPAKVYILKEDKTNEQERTQANRAQRTSTNLQLY